MVSLQREISLCSSLALSPSPVDHMVSLFSVFLGSVVIKKMEEPTSRYVLKVLRKPLERCKRRLQNELSTLKKSWKNLGEF
ncbi:hypothetical protein TorRG33x02_351510 [Trema orientale]|uniref:Uncharacterized protein n=1 Tax=Trema orientale TaxID=63057 RepID=A0A2P5AFK0_TREOI|nr:hypothetical protein TorRG33x02_351510 [Trema orientale]